MQPAVVVERALTLLESVYRAIDLDGRAALGLGLAVPALVQDGRTVRLAPNLPGWADLPLTEMVAARLGRALPVEAENEANLAAMAEFWYGGGAARDFIHVSGEVGVGGGVVVDGRLFRGVRGFAGELGHVTVHPDGPACGCGSRGCLEQYAGQDALLRGAGVTGEAGTRAGDPEGPVHELVRRAEAADERTLATLAEAGTALGVAVAAMVNVLDVGTVVLGGLYAPLAPWLREPVSAQLRLRVLADTWAPVRLVVSSLGGQAAVRGAAGMWVDRVLHDPVAQFPSLLGTAPAGGD